MLVIAGFLIACLGLLPAASAVALDRPTIYSRYRGAVLFVETTGELYNGERETTTGTGVLISLDGYALTAKHVVFDRPQNYKSVAVAVRVGGRFDPAPRLTAKVVDRHSKHDVALLKIDDFQAAVAARLGASSAVQVGEELTVLGFPATYDISISGGVLSARDADSLWRTDAALNPGNSGGPVFSQTGRVIGIVSRGAVKLQTPEGTEISLEGIKFFVPSDALSGTFLVGRGGPTVEASSALTVKPALLRRAYEISQTKDDHPSLTPDTRRYSFEFPAEPGYRIMTADVTNKSDTRVSNLVVDLSPGRDNVKVAFDLTSGPIFDRWRGWLHATVLTVQQAAEVVIRAPHTASLAAKAASVTRSFEISETKDDHPSIAPHTRRYSVEFKAEPGYRIVDAQLVKKSDTRVSDLSVNVSPTGERVRVEFGLTSGPLFDRWRGWLHATLVTKQEASE